eukprot:9475986-Pyramimonas_sp.AAC.1
MEHSNSPKEVTLAGRTSPSKALMGASSGNLLSCISAHVRGQLCSRATVWWFAYVASLLMCLMASSNFPCRVVRALRVGPQAFAKAVLYSRWTFCQGMQMPIAASIMSPIASR